MDLFSLQFSKTIKTRGNGWKKKFNAYACAKVEGFNSLLKDIEDKTFRGAGRAFLEARATVNPILILIDGQILVS